MFLVHGSHNGNQQILASLEILLDLLTNLIFRQLHIILCVTRISDQGQEPILNINQHVLLADNIGDIHVMGRGRNILVLLSREDVNSNQIDLGVPVLPGLAGAHVDYLARAAGNVDEAVLAEGGALDGVDEGGTAGGLVEGLVLLVRHGNEDEGGPGAKSFEVLKPGYIHLKCSVTIYFLALQSDP